MRNPRQPSSGTSPEARYTELKTFQLGHLSDLKPMLSRGKIAEENLSTYPSKSTISNGSPGEIRTPVDGFPPQSPKPVNDRVVRPLLVHYTTGLRSRFHKARPIKASQSGD